MKQTFSCYILHYNLNRLLLFINGTGVTFIDTFRLSDLFKWKMVEINRDVNKCTERATSTVSRIFLKIYIQDINVHARYKKNQSCKFIIKSSQMN